jgi:hypothetical protein
MPLRGSAGDEIDGGLRHTGTRANVFGVVDSVTPTSLGLKLINVNPGSAAPLIGLVTATLIRRASS